VVTIDQFQWYYFEQAELSILDGLMTDDELRLEQIQCHHLPLAYFGNS
jgi:hypothetical protein